MKKLIILSSKEVLLLQSAISHWTFHINGYLNANSDKKTTELLLDDLDLCDSIRKKLSKVFSDLSAID